MRRARFWIPANVDKDLFSRRSAPAAPLNSTLVIGFGNGLRSDDGAGICAATLVAEQSPTLRVIATPQLTPDLAEDIASAAQLVFLDAYAAPEAGASLRVERVCGDGAGGASAVAHHASPAALVQLAKAIFGAAPDAWVVGIPAFSFAAGEVISPGTLHSIDEAVALIGGRALFEDQEGGST